MSVPAAPVSVAHPAVPYAPSWVHVVGAAIDRLPGPRWAAYAGIAVLCVLLQHAQVWFSGLADVGTLDRTNTYWGLFAAAFFWLPGHLERVARSAFERVRPELVVSDAEADRLGYELTIIPGSLTAVITVLAALATAASFVADPVGTSTAGLSPAMLVLAFALQVLVSAMLFQVVYRLIRQVRLVRRILAEAVEVDVFRPGPLHAIAALTARPGATFTLMLATVFVVIPVNRDPVAFLAGWGAYVVLPGILSAVSFFAPLTGAHHQLEGQKERLQDATEIRIRGVLSDLDRDVEARDLARVDAYQKALQALLVERDVLARLPTWPWSFATLRSFVSAILVPMALFLAQQVLSRVF